MKYALGNMLNGAGGLNADQLALDLQFAADKTLTARKGPTPTFTRASTGRFVGSDGLIQSAAVNAPRFDHDPVTLACKGLLIEESRTNLLLRSDDFASASWAQTLLTVSSNVTASPDGSTLGDLIIEDLTTGIHHIGQASPTITAGQPYTLSVFAKAASHNCFQISLPAIYGSGLFCNFVLSGSGSLGNKDATSVAKIESYPNGWYRCSLTAPSVVGGSSSFVLIVSINNNSSSVRNTSYLGTGAQVVSVWGAQLEAGSFATSYIPTTTASVIRSQDVCSISGSAFSGMWNALEGTLFVQTEKTSTNANAFVIHASAGFFSNAIDLRYTSITAVSSQINFSGLNQTPAFNAAIISGSSTKHSVAYRLNDCAYSVNGASSITDQSVSIPTSNQLTIGSAVSSSSHINGTISSLRYYRKRLANAKLQIITV